MDLFDLIVGERIGVEGHAQDRVVRDESSVEFTEIVGGFIAGLSIGWLVCWSIEWQTDTWVFRITRNEELSWSIHRIATFAVIAVVAAQAFIDEDWSDAAESRQE